MDPIIFTQRLKLTLVTGVERGSPEFDWLHELRSNKESTWWSIHGQAKSFEDTEKIAKAMLPTKHEGEKTYRVAYAVHKVLGSTSTSAEGEPKSTEQEKAPTELIGLVTLTSLDAGNLPLPEHLTLPAAAAATTLTVELGYMFLPKAWGKGYATESVGAVFEACKRVQSFWAPFSKVYIRAIVNQGNPASLRVMAKIGMAERGMYHWTGEMIYIGGEWKDRDELHIFGKHLID